MEIRGILPIVYTPFDRSGAIDEEDVRRLVTYLIAAGAHGLAATGGASESNKMSLDERRWLARVVIEEARGRVPVIMGVSAARTEDAVTLAHQAEALGAVAIFATPASQTGAELPALREHYGALANATSLPIMVQDSQPPVGPADVATLAMEIAGIEYVKEEAPDSGHRIGELRQRSGGRLRILSGGSYLLDDLARGAQGAIPGSVGVADLSRAYDCFTRGDLAGARAAYNHFLPLSFWRRQFALLGAKEVLRRLGVFKAAYLREPSGGQRLDEQDHRELSALMEAMGPPY